MQLNDGNLREWLDGLKPTTRLFVRRAMTLFSGESHSLEIETGNMHTLIREGQPSNPATTITVCMLGAAAAFSAMASIHDDKEVADADKAGEEALGASDWFEIKKMAMVSTFAAILDAFADESGKKTIVTKVEKTD